MKPDLVSKDVRQLHHELAQLGMVTRDSERQKCEILVSEMEQSWNWHRYYSPLWRVTKEASCWIDEVLKVKAGF